MSEPITSPSSSKLLRAAIWVAIGALIAAAVVCVVWVLIGDADGMIGKAFLTILLLAAFAGISILEASLASRRPAWLALASMTSWVVILLLGAFLIWMPYDGFMGGFDRFSKFFFMVVIVQLALLHVWLFTKAYLRHQTTFTSIVTYVTIALVVILVVLLVLPLMLDEYTDFGDLYWRIVVALAILAAVGTALVPLVNALFAPRTPKPVAQAVPQPGPVAWPTYADGRTPLPVMPDGAPDWNAYYTGQPTFPHGAPQPAPAPAAIEQPSVPAAPPLPDPVQPPAAPDAQPGYQGYPPPPAPPR